ncbi:unnamed protein product [Calypogeia fissa]
MEGEGAGERVPLREAEGSPVNEEMHSTERAGGLAAMQYLTVDGVLGVHQDEALQLARNFFYGGFCLLPWLWFVNCFYFWPVLRHRQSDPPIRFYVVRSAICCLTVSTILLGWSLTFAIGGKSVFGSAWEHLTLYNLADKYSMAWAQ